ncbi:MAG TPA: SDR family oxidoreductase [Enhygromyxa sp.]|nr:SDR family oxidoreductase [Enhygromyxa sp.]
MPMKEVVVITGASAGIGRALARRFARDGADIALLARGGIGLEAAAEEVTELGGRPLVIQVDVSDPDAVEAAARRIEEELGPIDIWINNAAVMLYGAVQDLSPAELRQVSDINYHGAVWGTMAALKRMRERGRGTIVQVGSGAAYRGIPWMSAYSAAKHALRAFSEALRAELIHDRIDVHLTQVHLSSINTPLYTWARNHLPRQAAPIPPIYEPELAAETIHWAAHARRREVFFGWTAIGASAINKLAPGLVDRFLARVGYEAQQTSEPVPPDHIDNLFGPVEGDVGTRGEFEARAQDRAPLVQLLARLGVGGLRVAALGVTLVALARAGKRD